MSNALNERFCHARPNRRTWVAGLLAAALVVVGAARAENAPGVTATEIKIGQTSPYSGPASNMSTMSRVEAAYFAMINDKGGINGRKITLISYDDGYQPSKTVEQTRRLIEQDGVAFLFHPIGTGGALAVARYLNQKEIPHVLVATGSSKFHQPALYPWSIAYDASGELEGYVFARYLLQIKPDSKIAVLYQNDDFGQSYLTGLRKGLGDKSNMIIATSSYEVADATVDSQMSQLRQSGADVFVNAAIPKFAAQAIRKAYDMGWKPLQFLTMKSNFFTVTLQAAGLDKASGIVSVRYRMDPADPAWDKDPGMVAWREFMTKYNPSADIHDGQNIDGFVAASIMADILQRCGDDLSRENIMAKATSVKDLKVPTLIPGITINTGKDNYNPISQLQVIQFDGANWKPVTGIIGAE